MNRPLIHLKGHVLLIFFTSLCVCHSHWLWNAFFMVLTGALLIGFYDFVES